MNIDNYAVYDENNREIFTGTYCEIEKYLDEDGAPIEGYSVVSLFLVMSYKVFIKWSV